MGHAETPETPRPIEGAEGARSAVQPVVRRGWAYSDSDPRKVGHFWRPTGDRYPPPHQKHESLCGLLRAPEHLVFSPEQGDAEVGCLTCSKKRWGDDS